MAENGDKISVNVYKTARQSSVTAVRTLNLARIMNAVTAHMLVPYYEKLTYFRTIALLTNRKQTCSGSFKELLERENDTGKLKMLKGIRTESCKPTHMEWTRCLWYESTWGTYCQLLTVCALNGKQGKQMVSTSLGTQLWARYIALLIKKICCSVNTEQFHLRILK
jgi:hypothetical protein